MTRLWRLVMDIKDMDGTSKVIRVPASVEPILRKTHQTIRKVTEDIDKRFRFNTAIAAMMELINELYKAKETVKDTEEAAVLKYSIEHLIIMLSPFVPHIADELWETIGLSGRLFEHPWPEFDPNVGPGLECNHRGTGERQAPRHHRNAQGYAAG